MVEKKKIFYSRQYRRFKFNKVNILLYLLLFVTPILILLIKSIPNISSLMSFLGVKVLGRYFPGIPMQIVDSRIAIIGIVEYIDLPTVYPKIAFTFLNFIVVILLLTFVSTGKRKGNIVSIFFTIALSTHLINCIYFIFASNYFPYSAFQYSDLYIKQQVGIWVIFAILTGLITGFLGRKGLFYKIAMFIGTILYSLVFGIIRYILFLYILQRFSVLYMALMFFVFGPFFDFLYLVGIYSIFMNKMIELYESQAGKDEWLWS